MSVRVSATDWVEDGLTPDESVNVAKAFVAAGADIIHVSTGQTVHDAKPVYGRLYQTPYSDRIRNEARVPTIAVGNITEADQVNRRIQQERQLTIQLILFGAVALLLCAIGIYGMLAYTVGFRTPEIGLRMALGAQRSNVVSMVIRESLTPVVIGIAMGLAAAFALTRLVESMLYGVKPNDPVTIALAAAVFLVIAAIAASVPARRASRTEPMSALRYL